jgi:drug/metabolite transporter (DMT)-like permease
VANASPAPASTEALPWAAFAACSAIWGTSFLVIRIGNDALAPVWAATLRLCLAAVLLSAVALVRGQRMPRGAALRAALAYGVCQFGINFPLLYWGETLVPSGLTAVIYATLPLTSALMARAFRLELLTIGKVAGSIVALAGVALLFSGSLEARGAPIGLLAILVGATAAGLGTIFLKRGPPQDAMPANAVGCVIGAVISLGISLARGEPQVLPASVAAAWPVLYLTVAGSLGAYVIMSWLVNRWPVTRVSYVTVIVPVIAVVLGAVIRHEKLPLVSLAGAGLVLAGLVVGTRGRGAPAR